MQTTGTAGGYDFSMLSPMHFIAIFLLIPNNARKRQNIRRLAVCSEPCGMKQYSHIVADSICESRILSEMARGNGSYREYMKKLKKTKLLILDEWFLYPLKESEARDVLELVEARSKTASTIFCSQFDVPGWHENLYDPTLADAICDRIVYDSYIIRVEGDSMRKRKGIMD